MQFPLSIAFKILTLVPQMSVRDAAEHEIGYVRSKLFAFRENVTVFSDATQSQPIYGIQADRVIDFTANYHFTDRSGHQIGFVRREGFKSLWRAHYIISVGAQATFEVREANPFVRLVDNLIGEIPFIGLLTGYILNPTYNVTRIGTDALSFTMTKQPAFLESRFAIVQHAPVEPDEQACLLLGLMMIILLERARG
ncbi:MAG: hypothetical protein R3D67_10850 [Hyphomicrobiaceae bacterium]